ncbi:MAG: bifunctional UDP-sugar hydrolase/5'-nucleotidase [Eubacteriales bacterium]|nr:bifunctional UDP-sugar hydrolase/5'-nucleotidase [Eubacteriales bacterium]
MKKRVLCLALALLMVLSLAPMAFAAEDAAGEVIILHTNDVHGYYNEGVGVAKIAGYKKALQADGKGVVLVDAGDFTQGALMVSLYKGATAYPIIKAAGYDYMTLGNHEFDYGPTTYKALAKKAGAKVLVANIAKAGTKELILPGWEVKEIGGVKIGFFGLATPETKTKAHPDNTAGLDFKDLAVTSQYAVDQLKAAGAQYIVCIGHLGMDVESNGVRSIDVVSAVKGIDLFVDGHSHTELPTGYKVNNTLIVSTGEKCTNLGKVTLTVKDGKVTATAAALLNADAMKDVQADAKTDKLIKKLVAKTEKATSQVIGSTPVLLDGTRAKVRGGETNLSRFVTDIFRDVTGADVVMTNGGGIRASIEKGKITVGDVRTVFPFGNSIVVKEVTGSVIRSMMTFGLKSYPNVSGGMPQVSGMTYKIKAGGGAPYDIMIGGEPLVDSKVYTLATNDFTAAGGDGYDMLKPCKLVAYYGGMEQIIIDYIKKNGVKLDDTPRLIVE